MQRKLLQTISSYEQKINSSYTEFKLIFTNFNIQYFSRKKTETEEAILKMENKLKNYSNQESVVILVAFFLQLLVFLSVQYFEVTVESANAKRTAKK